MTDTLDQANPHALIHHTSQEALLPAVDSLELKHAVLASWCYLRHANYLHPLLTDRLLHRCIALLNGDSGGERTVAQRARQGRGHVVAVASRSWEGINLHISGEHREPHPYKACLHQQDPHHPPEPSENHHHQHLTLLHDCQPQDYQPQQHQQHDQHPQHKQHPQHHQHQPHSPPCPQQQHDVVLLLTLAASFASSHERLSDVQPLFSSIAARAAHMQQSGPLGAAESGTLTHLLAILDTSSSSSSFSSVSASCSALGEDARKLGGVHALDSDGRRRGQVAYPALPLSLRLTPTYPTYQEITGPLAWGDDLCSRYKQ